MVPPTIPRPDYADHPKGHPLGEIAERGSTQVKVLDDEEIEGMRVACRVIHFQSIQAIRIVPNQSFNYFNALKLAREVLNEAAKVADVGVTTDEIDRVVHEAAIERECYPSPLNYYEL